MCASVSINVTSVLLSIKIVLLLLFARANKPRAKQDQSYILDTFPFMLLLPKSSFRGDVKIVKLNFSLFYVAISNVIQSLQYKSIMLNTFKVIYYLSTLHK